VCVKNHTKERPTCSSAKSVESGTISVVLVS